MWIMAAGPCAAGGADAGAARFAARGLPVYRRLEEVRPA
jgi:hypothetical protein